MSGKAALYLALTSPFYKQGMDIGFNQNCWAQITAHDVESADLALIDWAVLRTRFLAAHDARRAMRGSAHMAGGGSFDTASARLVSAQNAGLAVVNRVALSNGKAVQGKQATVADHVKIGG